MVLSFIVAWSFEKNNSHWYLLSVLWYSKSKNVSFDKNTAMMLDIVKSDTTHDIIVILKVLIFGTVCWKQSSTKQHDLFGETKQLHKKQFHKSLTIQKTISADRQKHTWTWTTAPLSPHEAVLWNVCVHTRNTYHVHFDILVVLVLVLILVSAQGDDGHLARVRFRLRQFLLVAFADLMVRRTQLQWENRFSTLHTL